MLTLADVKAKLQERGLLLEVTGGTASEGDCLADLRFQKGCQGYTVYL